MPSLFAFLNSIRHYNHNKNRMRKVFYFQFNPYTAGYFMYTLPLINLQNSSYEHIFTSGVENSADPDQLVFRSQLILV